jgi:Leucine-rich repeat (LRR) protein
MKNLMSLLIAIVFGLTAFGQTYNESDVAALISIRNANPGSALVTEWANEELIHASTLITWEGEPKRVTALYLDNKSLSTLDASGLSALKILSCTGNTISSLKVAGLANLQNLWCEKNQITLLDLSGLSNLTFLSCGINSISTLDVSNLTKLDYLYCHENLLTTLDVSMLPNLVTFNCEINQISTIRLNESTHYSTLAYRWNNLPFSQLAFPEQGTSYYYSPQNKVFNEIHHDNPGTPIDYSAEASIGGVATSFTWYRNGDIIMGTDQSGIFAPSEIGYYHCTMTNEKFPGLVLETNRVTVGDVPEFDPGDMTALRAIRDANPLSALATEWATDELIQASTSLIWEGEPKRVTALYLDFKSLTAIDATPLIRLKDLYCSQNNLNLLNVAGLSNLESLNCDNNQLSVLDLTGVTNLNSLSCAMNMIEELDISGSKVLNLWCGDNKLKKINFSGLTYFTYFKCLNNNLPFSQLPLPSMVGFYDYYAQNKVYEERMILPNTAITDYLPEASIDGSPSVFEWYLNGVKIEGGAQSTYTPTIDGEYHCMMTNEKFPGLTLTTNTITVLTPSVTIVSSPEGEICQGTSVTFTATSDNGGENPTFQWKKNGDILPGETNSTFSSSTLENGDIITVEMQADFPVDPVESNSILMQIIPTVGKPSEISIMAGNEPGCQLTNSITTTTYSTTATDNTGFNWSISNLSAGSIDASSGVMTWNEGFSGEVEIQVTANGCNGPSEMTIRSVVVLPLLPVSVSIAASATEVCSGTQVTFTANATNAGSNPTFQWLRNGTAIQGEINAVFRTTALADGDNISVVMYPDLPLAPVYSNVINMTVNPLLPVSVSIAASANPVTAGTPVTFTATPVNGGTQPAFEWYVNSIMIASGNAGEYTYTPVNGDQIYVVMTSSEVCTTGNPATSNVIVMSVTNGNNPPEVVCNDISVALGATGSYSLSLTDLRNQAAGTSDDRTDFRKLIITTNPTVFSCDDTGSAVRTTITVTDLDGASSTCTSLITVLDLTGPVFATGTKSIRVTLLTGETYTLPDLSSIFPATDNCGTVTYSQSVQPGTVYSTATTATIFLIATDGAGNFTEALVKLTISIRKSRKSAEMVSILQGDPESNLMVYPNPFNERLSFEFDSPGNADVKLDIYNISGSKLQTVFDGHIMDEGPVKLEYVADRVTSQMVIYKLIIDGEVIMGKAVYNKR